MSHPNPQRRWYALMAGGVVLLCAVVFLLTWFLTGETLHQPRESGPLAWLTSRTSAKPPRPPSAPVIPPLPKPDRRAIDPEIQKMADDLAEKTQTPARDLEIVGEFIGLYRKVFHGNPIGLNEDITAGLTGHNPKEGILFPPSSSMIIKGQLVDRWGTPYWFHPNTATQMEIRSAGPDKDLFTSDDLVVNPGPNNMGFNMAGQ